MANNESLEDENISLKASVFELKELLKQQEVEKQQLQASYDEALQALADSEAKRETAERELKVAQDQMTTMWKELDMLHRRLDGSQSSSTNLDTAAPASTVVNEGSLELCCTLCQEKIRSESPSPTPPTPSISPAHTKITKSPKTSKLWPFGSRNKNRLSDMDDHSKVCSSQLVVSQSKSSPSPSPSLTSKLKQKTPSSRSSSPGQPEGHNTLVVNVTRTPTAATDLAPFKVVTRTNMSHFQRECYEVYRSAGDFHWLHDVLQDNCPERIVPPLRSTISLDATVSEYQRFLSRLIMHKTLRTEQFFITFLTGTVEELRVLRAKFRPHLLPSEEGLQYRPTQGRDTSSGALVATKNYLQYLEEKIVGLVQVLHQPTTEIDREGTMSHWFHQIADGEPCDTYLKLAAGDLARTCEVIEMQHGTTDGDDTLFIQNLQSVADYIHSASDLLARVEQAVDKFLYWDEEVMIYEAVTSSPNCDTLITPNPDEVFDDSGVSSVSGSSGNSQPNEQGDGNLSSPQRRIGDDSISEKWAQASSNCSDAKEYLEMICRDLSDELSHFDLRKEQELRQVFLDLAASQLEKNEKLQGKWYAMSCLLDVPIKTSLRAIQFVSNPDSAPSSSEDQTKRK